jgi:hypothetical protein
MKIKSILSISAAAAALLVSCKKEVPEPVIPPIPNTYTVPATYDFGASTSFTVSAQRLNMQKELITYLRSAHNATTNVTLDAQKLQNFFANTGSPFADASLNTSGTSIKEKTSNTFGMVGEIQNWLDEAAATSAGGAEAKDGVAGKMLGPVPSNSTATRSSWLLNASGFEYKELVEKGLMGAMQYAEAMRLLKNIGSFEHNNAAEGSAMERAWDEAFGYFGVPASFPTTTTGLSYWGNYCNSVNAAIGSNATIMNAFLKGRAAITNKDNAGRDEARDIVVATWEKVGAAKLIAYLKQAKTNFAVDGLRSHALSEGYGFIRAFRYNDAKKITEADIVTLENLIGDNLYQVSITNIDLAIEKVSTVFGIDATKL